MSITFDAVTVQCLEDDILYLQWNKKDRIELANEFADLVRIFLQICGDQHNSYDDDYDTAWQSVANATLETAGEAVAWARNRFGYTKD